MEVHIGGKSARPGLALGVSAVALVGVLGLATWQVAGTRALNVAHDIAGIPVRLYLNERWRPTEAPGTFVLPAPEGLPVPFAKALSVSYFEDGPDLAQAVPDRATPAPLSDLEGFHWSLHSELRNSSGPPWRLEGYARLAPLPGGGVVQLEFVAVTEIAVGRRRVRVAELTSDDREMFDDVARALEITARGDAIEAADVLERAGIAASLPADVTAGAAIDPRVRGGRLFGRVDGLPGWTLGVFRSWLADGRTPADLAESHARLVLDLRPDQIEIARSTRGDGYEMLRVTAPLGEGDGEVVWVVADGNRRIAMVLLSVTRGGARSAAIESARQLAETLRFQDEGYADGGAAARAGRQLAQMLRGRDPVPAESGDTEVVLGGEGAAAEIALLLQRERQARGARRGKEVIWYPTRVDKTQWFAPAGQRGFTRSFQRYDPSRPAEVTEAAVSYQGDDGVIEHTHRWDRRDVRSRLVPGAGFVAPPHEASAEFAIASGASDTATIDVLTSTGRAASVRLIPLTTTEDGLRRVLSLIDYMPSGTIATYAADGTLERIEVAEVALERLAPDEATRRYDRLLQLAAEWDRPELPRD